MTVSLAAVFIPLVFMSGLMGRIFREFSITIVISILASGIVSLTLTPLMTSRLLGNRGEGAKKTWMERVFGAVERRVLDFYGRSLWFFLRNRWISAVAWGICLAAPGTSSIQFQNLSCRLAIAHSFAVCWLPRKERRRTRCTRFNAGGKDHARQPRGAQHVYHERQQFVPGSKTRRS